MFDYEDEEKTELSVIKELMEQLVSEMKPGADDFEERLGRKKPDVAIMKVEAGVSPEEEMEEEAEMAMGEAMSPESKLKERLMKLRA